MFGDIVAVVFFSGCPVVSELALIFSVSEPMVLHVHCLEFFHDIVVDNAEGGCVVRLHWGRWLGVSHVFQCVSCWDSPSRCSFLSSVVRPNLASICNVH